MDVVEGSNGSNVSICDEGGGGAATGTGSVCDVGRGGAAMGKGSGSASVMVM